MPPKRAERAADSVPDASTEPPESTETIEERHARLTMAVRAQRQLAEIEEMERELREGSSPAGSRASAGTFPAPEMGAGQLKGQWRRLFFGVPLFGSCGISSKGARSFSMQPM